jgi:hypothetical protein
MPSSMLRCVCIRAAAQYRQVQRRENARRYVLPHDREHKRARRNVLEVPARHLEHKCARARDSRDEPCTALDTARLPLRQRRLRSENAGQIV